MKMIQKTQKQTKHLQFPTLPDDEIGKSVTSLNSKQREASMFFIHRLKIILNMAGMMLNQCIYISFRQGRDR